MCTITYTNFLSSFIEIKKEHYLLVLFEDYQPLGVHATVPPARVLLSAIWPLGNFTSRLFKLEAIVVNCLLTKD